MHTINKTLINTTPFHNPTSSPITNILHYIPNTTPPQPLNTFIIHLTTRCTPDSFDPTTKNLLDESYLSGSALQPKISRSVLRKGYL